MLPTSPRALARSTCSSCTTPCSSIATRVSCGVTLIRISLFISKYGKADARQDFRRFVQRQPHHAGVAAVDVLRERGRLALDRIASGLVEGLAGRDVALDLVLRNDAERDVRYRDRQLEMRLPAHGHRGDDLVLAPGERRQHRCRAFRV